MASWIGATDAQRFKQYTQPAAHKAVASNYKETFRAQISSRIRELRAQFAAAETEFVRRKINRRIRAELNEWKRVCDAWERDITNAKQS